LEENKMLHVCAWKWDNGIPNKKGIRFSAQHVNTLGSMLKRHLHTDYEFCCITDDPEGIDKDIRIIPIWNDYLDKGGCWTRLKMFDASMKDIIGERFVSIDLDCVIVDDITPILTCIDDFRIWGEHWRKSPYCGSLWIMDAGCRSEVWTEFDMSDYPVGSNGRWKKGTDQARINDCLYPDEMMWSNKDGIYNFRDDIRMDDNAQQRLKVRRRGLTDGRTARREQIENAEDRAEEKARENCKTNGRPARIVETIVKKARLRARKKMLYQAAKEAKKERAIYKDMKKKEDLGHVHSEGELPEDARIIFFNGSASPDDPILLERYKWLKENYK